MLKITQITKLSLLVIGAASVFGLVSCEKKGPAEKAGEKMDDAIEKTGDEIEDATDN